MKGDMTYMNENPSEYDVTEQQWNLEELSKVFKEVYPSATWIELIKFLDVDIDAREDFYFQSQDSFNVFMKLWNSLKPASKSFPVEFLIANSWKNKRAQVTCLEFAISYSYQNSDIPFEKAKRRQDHNKQLQGIKPSVATFSRIWNCIDLVQTLVNLSDSNHYYRVKEIFEPALKSNPEYLLLTLIKIKTKNGRFLLEEMYSQLLPIFLTGHPNSIPMLNEVWNVDKNLVINSISSLYTKNQKSMNLSRVLDICQSIKNSLLMILETCKDYNFTIQLALLAAKRDFLHFERSIEKMIQAEGDPLFHALFKYIYTNLIIPIENSNNDLKKREEIVERSLLSEERLQIIVDKLIKFKDQNPTQVDFITNKKFEEIYIRLIKIFSNIQTEEHPNNELIEEKGNEYFQQLYKGEKSVEDLVKIMKDFRSSANSTEREIYACMVQNLFDEWKFFPKYPKKELEMTAKLFGKIMSERKIIDGVVTDIGLKCIVEGLKREGKMFLFSITALEECKNSVEHENGLKNILSCQQLQEKKPDLYQHILRRYHQLHSNTEPQQPPITENKQVKPQNTMGDVNRQNQPMKTESIPASNTPDQRPNETGFNQNMQRQNKPKNPNPMANTPTQPGKYFTPDQNAMSGWKPQGQMGANRNLYPPGSIPPSMSTRLPQDSFSLGGPVDPSNADKRSLNPLSRKFMPKTQQVQEYLKKDEMKLPSDFMDNLITILNMTGTDQIYGKAQELESQMKDEYVEKMAHFTVVKRVTDADEKRIQFYSDFFYSMKNRNITNSLIKECIHVIMRIITTELAENSNRNEISRAASNPVKNVSLFLGYLTIRHERPLLLTELDLKQLLVESEIKKWMVSAMIVVCKILRVGDSGDFRGVFNRYNPWMQGLYSLLVEYKKNFCQLNRESDKIIYNEIQLVLKNTQLNENQIRESTLFRDLMNKETRNNELNHLLRKIDSNPYIVVPEVTQEEVQEGEGSKEEDLQHIPDDFSSEKVTITETSEKFTNIEPKVLKSLVIKGINYAMKEIIDAVIRRVIPIASITTRSLVLKDFALETDPNKLKSAAETTSKSLAGMLALIT